MHSYRISRLSLYFTISTEIRMKKHLLDTASEEILSSGIDAFIELHNTSEFYIFSAFCYNFIMNSHELQLRK